MRSMVSICASLALSGKAMASAMVSAVVALHAAALSPRKAARHVPLRLPAAVLPELAEEAQLPVEASERPELDLSLGARASSPLGLVGPPLLEGASAAASAEFVGCRSSREGTCWGQEGEY